MKETDVLIIGGAFAGASAALLLRRENPSLRVTVVERKTSFDRKVGEATTEISGAFLTKRLGITDHLLHHHITKNGLRFWFDQGPQTPIEALGELGARFNVRLPSYQVDRGVLDEFLLARAVAEGAECLRPAKVLSFNEQSPGEPSGEPLSGGFSTVEIETGGRSETWRARWVLDASGKVAWLARRKKLLRDVPEHPTNALWGRFRGLQDMDGWEWRERYPQTARRVQTSRVSATNHLTGYGWWCWIIPLKGGDTSVGLVYDERRFTPPTGDSIAGRLLTHVRSHALGREIFAHAEPVPGDAMAYSHMPYYAEEIAGPGWQLMGDAAGFMDPLYSAGLDYGSWTVSSAVQRIAREARGESVDYTALNNDFVQSYQAWLRGLYLDKYAYLGDQPLMTAAYLMDLGLFFFGPVREVVKCPRTGFSQFPFCGPVDKKVAKVMAFYNARLADLAEEKRQLGLYGRENGRRHTLIPGFAPSGAAWWRVLDGAALWAREELRLLWARHRRSHVPGRENPGVPEVSGSLSESVHSTPVKNS